MQNANNTFTEKRIQNSAELPKTHSNKTKNMPKDITEKTCSDIREMIAITISDQKIIQQFAPKIVHTILTNQLEVILSQEPQPTNPTKNQKIIELTEQIITPPPFLYRTSQNEVFTSDEIKNAIYKYNNLLSEITALSKKYDDINLLAKLTHILDFTARNYTSSPSD